MSANNKNDEFQYSDDDGDSDNENAPFFSNSISSIKAGKLTR